MAAWWPYWIFWFPDSRTLVWLWISTPNLSGTILMYMCRSLLIFSNVNFKMAARQPYWNFWFPDSNFSLALNINCKLKWHNTYTVETPYNTAPYITGSNIARLGHGSQNSWSKLWIPIVKSAPVRVIFTWKSVPKKSIHGSSDIYLGTRWKQ